MDGMIPYSFIATTMWPNPEWEMRAARSAEHAGQVTAGGGVRASESGVRVR